MTKPTTPKPIPIPRDLKRGDVVVINKPVEGETHLEVIGICQDGGYDWCRTSFLSYRCDDGIAHGADEWFVVHIIRKTSKPALVDRDAKWLLELVAEGRHKLTPSATKRLRAIARRLSGEGKP